MRCLVLIAVVITGTVARPETYREKEDFQYSRSSSDEGSKSGYYGAQRGNMGGNYERAHNMDSHAQHQMSGLIHQVEGEIEDASNTNTGSVYTAANSRGMYGSGHYDLSNLEGRNFQEGTSYGGSHSQSALTNSAYRNHASGSNAYSNSYSHSSRQSSLDQSEHEQREEVQSSNLRSGEATYQQEHGAYGGTSSHGYSWSPHQNRLVSTRPMRILVRPGSKVTVPLATQTYDADHSASSYDASAYNHNAAKSDAEIIINNDHETREIPISKHYESSYSYRKEWEKHHSSPGAVPLGVDIDSSIPKTNELYDDSQHTQTYNNRHQYTSNAADSHSQNYQSSNLYGYNSRNNLALSSQSKHQSDYDVQREKLSSDALTLNTQQSNVNQDYANQQESLNSKPKSYQSSYSYHKSWERQGDPYVIVPVPGVQNGQASQRLSTASNSHSGYSSHQHGSKTKQSQQSYTSSNGFMDCDCDDEGHIRVARSYNTDQEVQQQQNGWEDFGQESQNLWDGQTQNQGDRIEVFGQQTQTHFDKVEDLSQQTQNHWDKIEDLGQQTQSNFDKIEDLGQQTQKHWDEIEDLGQQTQTNFDQQSQKDHWDHSLNLEQQSQNQFDKIEDLGQHSQSQWNQYNSFDQQSQSIFGQEQATWNKLEKSNEDNINSHSNSTTYVDDVTHYTDKQAESDSNTVEHQNYFYTHLSNDFHTHQDESLSDVRPQHSSSINSLWDKLDRLSGVSTFNSNHSTQEYTSFINNEHSSNYSNKSTTTDNVLIADKNVVIPKDLGRGDIPDTTAVNPKNIGRGDIPDTPEGSELLNHFTTEKVNVVSTTASGFDKRKNTEYGTLNDIEALSLTEKHQEITEKPKGASGKTNMNIEMDIMNQQIEHSNKIHYVNHNFQDKQVLEESNKKSMNYSFEIFNNVQQSEHSYEEKHNSNENNNRHLGQAIVDLSKMNETSNQKNLNNYNGGFDQQSENLNQHNKEQETQSNEKPVNIFDQQNLDQNLESVNKWNENFDGNNMNHEHFGETNPQNVEQETQHLEKPVEVEDQQNLEKSLVDFTKWNENLDQHSINHRLEGFDQQNQQNMEQELQSFDKSGDMFDQQNFNQNSVDSSLFSVDPHQQSIQQSESFHQDSDNLNQQNEGELQGFNKFSDNFDQQNTNGNFNYQNRDYGFDPPNENFHQQEQNIVDFSQFNENYDQQSMSHSQNFERFNQQREKLEHQNMGQELKNYDKPDENFDQQNLNQNLNDFSQLNEEFNQQHTNHGSQDLSKSTDSYDQNFNTHNLQHHNYNHQFGSGRENYDQNMQQHFTSSAPLSEIVHTQVPKNNLENIETQHSKLLSTQQNVQHADSQPTLPTEPEQTGFWASVGKKFTNAKDKVASWFRRQSD